jgi:hypothetical protein
MADIKINLDKDGEIRFVYAGLSSELSEIEDEFLKTDLEARERQINAMIVSAKGTYREARIKMEIRNFELKIKKLKERLE